MTQTIQPYLLNEELRANLKRIQPNLIVSKMNREELHWWLDRPSTQPVVPKRLPAKTRKAILLAQPQASRTTTATGIQFIRHSQEKPKPPTVPHLPDDVRATNTPPALPPYPPPAYDVVVAQQDDERLTASQTLDVYDELLKVVGAYIDQTQSGLECVTPREPVSWNDELELGVQVPV